jgi:hypothetical protein
VDVTQPVRSPALLEFFAEDGSVKRKKKAKNEVPDEYHY